MQSARLLILALVVCVTGSPVLAWNPAGHMTIASIAYDQIAPQRRADCVRLLKAHPRFEPDFVQAMPEGLTSEQADRWLFMRAAAWPDLARSLIGDDQKYNHPTWHYIDWPLFLDGAARQKIHPPPIETDYRKGMDDATLNAVQALNKSLGELNDASRSPAQKAVALCWVLHLCGDIHQPLHGATLYSAARFRMIPLGDRGGNGIPIEQKLDAGGQSLTTNLHAVWDGLLGRDESFHSVISAAHDLVAQFPAEKLAEGVKNLDAKSWSEESRDLAEGVAYSPAVRAAVVSGEAHPLAPLAPIALSEEYVQKARAVACERTALAGYRTAALLQRKQ